MTGGLCNTLQITTGTATKTANGLHHITIFLEMLYFILDLGEIGHIKT